MLLNAGTATVIRSAPAARSRSRSGVISSSKRTTLCRSTTKPLLNGLRSIVLQRAHSPQVRQSRQCVSVVKAAIGSASFAGGAGEVTFRNDTGILPVTPPASNNIKLAVYVALWYGTNVVFNIVNKQTLNAFPMPYAIATWQLMASVICGVFMWATKLQPVPKVDGKLMKALLPIALFHTIGHVSACVSFSLMAISFSHVIKASEPIFSVALSGPLLGKTFPWYVWLSLVPIVAGCSLSAMKELSFSWPGFNNAMYSNIGMVMRNILSKKLMGGFKDLGGINLFILISAVSLLYCIPLACVMESSQWIAALKTAELTIGCQGLFQLLGIGGLFYHLYNQASYMVLGLEGVTPVTLSVGNTMKRVAVVASSVIFFRNPVSILNWVGSFAAIAGTGLYGLATDKATNDAKALKSA